MRTYNLPYRTIPCHAIPCHAITIIITFSISPIQTVDSYDKCVCVPCIQDGWNGFVPVFGCGNFSTCKSVTRIKERLSVLERTFDYHFVCHYIIGLVNFQQKRTKENKTKTYHNSRRHNILITKSENHQRNCAVGNKWAFIYFSVRFGSTVCPFLA